MANDILNLENRDKVMAKGAFAPEPKAGYSNDLYPVRIRRIDCNLVQRPRSVISRFRA